MIKSNTIQKTELQKLGIYVHIPFCVRKCLYCDFLSAPGKEEDIESYVNSLLNEISFWKDKTRNYVVDTVFFGGGTPSTLEGVYITKILCELKNTFRFIQFPEISIEVNPGTVDEGKLKAYRSAGVNRLSIGLQSANDSELRKLGRIHSYSDFEKTYRAAQSVGFTNINVDLMSAIPTQNIVSYEDTIQKVMKFMPQHISSYSLIVEEGTPFAEMKLELVEEEEERLMYERTKELLQEAGYHRYEISNYALEGFECKHNSGYWRRKDYLGLGLGASSLMDSVRWRNTTDLKKYTKFLLNPLAKQCKDEWREEKIMLNRKDCMEEFMFLGLRLTEGVSKLEFARYFNEGIETVFGTQIVKLKEEKLISEEKDRIVLTDFGVDVSNYVFSQFLLD